MTVSSRLLRASRFMAWLSTAGFLIMPAITIYELLDPQNSQWLMFDIDHLGVTSAVPLQHRVMALAFELVAVSFTMWALWSLRRLFLLYAKGEVFSSEALNALNHVALALFSGVIANFLLQAPISYILTMHNPPGHRAVSLGFGSNDIATLFMAGVVLVIARVMAEAHRVAEENAKFV